MARSRNKKPPSILARAFEKSDSVSAGPFAIKKMVGANWEEAHFFVQGQEVNLSAQQKKIMAVMISQIDSGVKQADVSDKKNMFSNSLKVQIHKIRRTIRANPNLAPYADQIVSANPCRSKGDKGKWLPDARERYVLKEQTPTLRL